jgi:DNA-binding NarL/FixJ family response regulator
MIDEQRFEQPRRAAEEDPAVRIVIVDDHPSYAQGMASLFQVLGGIEVVGLAHSAEEALVQTGRHLPDIVLMDIRLPDLSGVEVTRKIRYEFPQVKVVALSASSEKEDVHGAMRAGASGYLLKQSDAGELAAAIKAVHSGQTVVEPSLVATLLAPHPDQDLLDEREIYLLKLLARGWELSRVAKEINVSESTVKRQVVQVQSKLGATNRIQAVVAAARRGLL